MPVDGIVFESEVVPRHDFRVDESESGFGADVRLVASRRRVVEPEHGVVGIDGAA